MKSASEHRKCLSEPVFYPSEPVFYLSELLFLLSEQVKCLSEPVFCSSEHVFCLSEPVFCLSEPRERLPEGVKWSKFAKILAKKHLKKGKKRGKMVF